MGSGEGRRVGPGGGSGGRAPGVEHRALDAGVGRRGWARGWAPGFGPGAGERVGRPKRRPGQLGGRTVGWAAGRPNGRVKEWKGWQGRTEKDGNGKGPGPSGSRSVKGSFGQPLRSAKGPVKGPVRPSLGPPEFLPERVDPVKSRPARVSACRGFVRSLPRSAKGLFRQGLGPSRVRSVTLPRSAKGRSVKVPARPGLGPSKVRSARASARRSSSPRESHPVKVRPARVSACQGFVRSPSPGQPKGRSVKVPAHPGLGPSKVRSARASARRSSSPRESHPVKVRSARASARRSSSPGGSPHPSTSGSPPHLFPFPPPSCPPPLLYRSGASYPSDAPPLHPAFRCG